MSVADKAESDEVLALNALLDGLRELQRTPLPTMPIAAPSDDTTFEALIAATGAVEAADDIAHHGKPAGALPKTTPRSETIAEIRTRVDGLVGWMQKLAEMELPANIEAREQGEDLLVEAAQELLAEGAVIQEPYKPQLLPDEFEHGVGKIDSETGSGVYVITKQVWSGSANVAVDSDDDFYQVSMREVNATTGLAAATVVTFREQRDQDGEVELVFGVPGAGSFGTPAVMLPAAFETEAAQSDTWDRANPPSGTDGVQVRIQMRDAYQEAGDEKWYADYRTFTIDSQGKVAFISAETRVIVDTPETC